MWLIYRVFLLSLLSFILSSCSPLKLINAFIPSRDYQVTKDILYGNHDVQSLDIYQPKLRNHNNPVLIWIHGGAWQGGNKDLYTFIGEAFTSQNLIVVIPNYRKYPNLFPDFLNDTAKAIAWTHANIERFGGNPDNFTLMGHSSGAHIALMLALNPKYLEQTQTPISAISSVIGLSGPYDFLPLTSPKLKEIFTPAKPLALSQPIHFAHKNAPPILLATGLKDKRVDPSNSTRLAKRIEAVGGQIVLRNYPTYSHSDILVKLARPLRQDSGVYVDVLRFMQKHYK